MVEQPQLLKAVIDKPYLDAPRLAYADWCATMDEEVMRLRAEFIRAQINLRHTAPEILRTGGAYGLQCRIGELSDRWGPLWARPLEPYVLSSSFQRGFVGLVKMTARSFLDNAEQVFSLAPIQHLDLTAVHDVDLPTLFASPQLDRLQSLALDDCGLHTDDIRLLASSPGLIRLSWLSLQNNHLDLDAARALAASPYLKFLRVARFSGNPVDPTESLGIESGEVVHTWLPESGEALEREFGPLSWLHWTPKNSRFDD